MHRMSQRAKLPYLSYICLRTLHDSSPKQLSDWSNSWEHSRPSIELNFSAFFTLLSAVPMQEHSKGFYQRQQDDVLIEPILAISHSSKSGRMFRSSTFGVDENRQGVPKIGSIAAIMRHCRVVPDIRSISATEIPQNTTSPPHRTRCRFSADLFCGKKQWIRLQSRRRCVSRRPCRTVVNMLGPTVHYTLSNGRAIFCVSTCVTECTVLLVPVRLRLLCKVI